ncbi:glycoside hydrolase [Candidatus Saccharibacteria bacterium]|nr:MAG: glycoside hydrolase [Candidatus Saccharibacteria bacterium]
MSETENTPEPETPADLATAAVELLKVNDQGAYTRPAEGMYPHQWLWDSCFIAIGLRHTNIDRAQTELRHLLRGQWSNGMLPNIIFNDEARYRRDRSFWRSWVSPYSPDGIATSGITQPPMLAEAVYQVGQKLNAAERRSWYKAMLPAIVAYHQWLYTDRDPHQEGLVLQVHPWETGLDNTPPWMTELHEHLMPAWIRLVQKTHADSVINLFRRDLKFAAPGERFSTIEILALFDAQRRLRRKLYQTEKILKHGLFAIEDLTYNCIFIRANTRLQEMAKTIRHELPADLVQNIARSREALEELWDEYARSYWSRDFITHRLLKQPSIAELMPLYAGCISKERADVLVRALENENRFGTAYPVPSVPADSSGFDPVRYWQGPSWLNTNWLVIQGLREYGYNDHADALTETSLEMVERSGFAEYFDPNTAEPLGADNFSWTAALTLDLLSTSK